ncbi:MAG TPA: hypothetical protein PKD09_00295 [Aggregatilinea sp.]|uniref:hypothetical protein n=1 Tax=Aggregatilinea sp. TaxID=2806333 RepID=UPI002BD23AA9|nr:hypothetical protein [Aggregatilinea sp.]HML20054.1 hypothetical protein [Aggregatilinea sp.]
MPQHPPSAVILVGPEGQTIPERIVTRAVRGAALDLVAMLAAAGVEPVIVAGPDLDWLPEQLSIIRDVDVVPFQFGQRLADLIERYDLRTMLYFGAGSAPLLPPDAVAHLLHACGEGDRVVVTNNLHSSDWIALADAPSALPVIRQADRDNSLAWMLHDSGLFDVGVLPDLGLAAGLDIDTPSDAALLAHYGPLAPHLAGALSDPLLEAVPVGQVIDVAVRDGSRIALIGRVSPAAWTALSRATQCWIRAYSEERGMAASERLKRGEVRSLLLPLYELSGPEGFFRSLADVADAAIMDSRVLMAASGHYPPDAERFASDLLMCDAIRDDWVWAFTQAAASASIPVLLGGHNVVASGLALLAQIVAGRRAAG